MRERQQQRGAAGDIGRAGPRLARHLDEAREVAGLGLDATLEHLEAVHAGGGLARDRGDRGIAAVAHLARRTGRVELGPHAQVGQRAQECITLGERLRMRDDGADGFEMRAGQDEQAMLDAAHHLGVQLEAQLGHEVVGLGHAARGRVLDRQQRDIGQPIAHGLGRTPERVVTGEQRTALAPAIAALCSKMAVGTLDTLIRHAQRRIRQRMDERLLARDAHLHDDAVEPLALMRVEPQPCGGLTHALQDLVLAHRVAER